MLADIKIRFTVEEVDTFNKTFRTAMYETSYDRFTVHAQSFTEEEATDNMNDWENDDSIVVMHSMDESSYLVAKVRDLLSDWYTDTIWERKEYIFRR